MFKLIACHLWLTPSPQYLKALRDTTHKMNLLVSYIDMSGN